MAGNGVDWHGNALEGNSTRLSYCCIKDNNNQLYVDDIHFYDKSGFALANRHSLQDLWGVTSSLTGAQNQIVRLDTNGALQNSTAVIDDLGILTINPGAGQYSFPPADGSNEQVLQTNGAGIISWGNALGYTTGTTDHLARWNAGKIIDSLATVSDLGELGVLTVNSTMSGASYTASGLNDAVIASSFSVNNTTNTGNQSGGSGFSLAPSAGASLSGNNSWITSSSLTGSFAMGGTGTSLQSSVCGGAVSIGGTANAASACQGSLTNNAGSSRCVLSSRRVASNTDYAVCGGYQAGDGTATTANRTWELNAVTGMGIFEGGTSTGPLADYAELFPNSSGVAIEAGYLVKLSANGVTKASASTDQIIGVVTSTQGITLNEAPFTWHNRYMRDDFGAYIYQTDSDGILARVENPLYDPNQPYTPRTDRPDQWTPVATTGQVRCRFNASFTPTANCFLTAASDGTITPTTLNAPSHLIYMTTTLAYDSGKGYGIALCYLGSCGSLI